MDRLWLIHLSGRITVTFGALQLRNCQPALLKAQVYKTVVRPVLAYAAETCMGPK